MAQASTWQRLSRNGAVRFGASVLLVLVLVALAAPWLGTVDPAAMDASHIYAPAGTRAPLRESRCQVDACAMR